MLDILNDLQNTLSGVDIRIKMQHKAGWRHHFSCLGYLNVRVEYEGRQVNTVDLDPKRAPLVRKAWELYATGDYSIDQFAATMADLGLTTRPTAGWPEGPVSDTKLHQCFVTPTTRVMSSTRATLYPGRHEPIVDQDLFDRVQEVLDARSAANVTGSYSTTSRARSSADVAAKAGPRA